MASTYQESVEQTITAGEQIHQIVNGTATTEVTVEDGSKVPSIRKALLDNFYFKDPITWQVGQTENVFNQLRQFTNGSWWYAPSATASNPISMGSTPVGDPLWKIYDFDAIGKLTPQLREALRRSYADAGYNLVDGSFEAGGTLVNTNDVLLQERTGKAFSGPAGIVAAGTSPASGGFVDSSMSGFTKTRNITSFMSPQQVADCALLSPTLDYTAVVNSAFSDSSNNNYELVVDSSTTLRITQPLATVPRLKLRLDGVIQCEMNDVSAVYVGGDYCHITGRGGFDGMGNNIRRFVRSPFVDGQTGKIFRVLGVGGRLSFNNVLSTTFHRSVDVYDEGVDFDVRGVLADNIAATPNGTVGDLNGSCRAVYVGGSTTGANQSFGEIDDVLAKNLLPFEDGDAVHAQSNNTAPFSIRINNIKGYNVAKRVVKVQMNGVVVDGVVARADGNAQSMYAIVSMYGNGHVTNVFGTGKIMNGVDSFNTVGRTLINGVNVQSTQTENEQQACVALAGGDIEARGIHGFGCFYSVFARSISAPAKYIVRGITHKAKNYPLRILADAANAFNEIDVGDYALSSDSTTLPSIISAGSIGRVIVGKGSANTTSFVGASFGHAGKLFVNGLSAPNCGSHGVDVLSSVTGGELNDISVAGSTAAHAAIVKCGGMLISNLRGGSYSTLRFDGVAATGNKADGIVTGPGNIRPYEEINGAAGNTVSGVTPFVGTATYDPPSLANGARATTTVTVTGARFGDRVSATFSVNTSGVDISAWVSANDAVTVSFYNNTGATVDIASGVLNIKAYRA